MIPDEKEFPPPPLAPAPGTVCNVVGMAVGAAEGVAVGAADGVSVGAAAGDIDGDAVELGVGAAVGAVGTAVGNEVGEAVGTCDGAAVGAVGAFVGTALGAQVLLLHSQGQTTGTKELSDIHHEFGTTEQKGGSAAPPPHDTESTAKPAGVGAGVLHAHVFAHIA
jgi:hypothetical protein